MFGARMGGQDRFGAVSSSLRYERENWARARGSRGRTGRTSPLPYFDDTDNATLENVAPVYDFLAAIGMRTTKSVWPIRGQGAPAIGGATCEDPDYLAWTIDLQARGFEIGYHGATYLTSSRDTALRAIERCRALYGLPSLDGQSRCLRGLHVLGADRVSGVNRLVYNLLTRFTRRGVFSGHREGDPLFWGDVCRERVRYVPHFHLLGHRYAGIVPHDALPRSSATVRLVNRWCASSEGADVIAFNRCVSEANQDRLRARAGACIMYTHFASGFWSGGEWTRVSRC